MTDEPRTEGADPQEAATPEAPGGTEATATLPEEQQAGEPAGEQPLKQSGVVNCHPSIPCS